MIRKAKKLRVLIQGSGSWPVTYRWVAMGTLMAYTAFGGTKVVLGETRPVPGSTKAADGEGQTQALVVRRFDIPAGTMDVVLVEFEKVTAIHVTVSEEGIRTLASPGVTGLYTPEKALVQLLGESGVTYRFTSTNAVVLKLAGVNSSVEVTAEALKVEGTPKFTESLRETPQTIDVVPQVVLQEQGVSTLRDALRNVAGISLAAGEGGAQGDNLTIRGYSARNDIFMDGMRDFGSYYRDSFDMEEVAVLQGPSSMTFGRGSTGGVVNQVTKTPEQGHFIGGTVQLGNDLTRRFTTDINQPIGQTTAFRLNVMGNMAKVAERDVAENRRFGVAPALTFGLGTPTRLTLTYLHEQENDIPDYGIPWLFNGPAPVDRENYYGFRDTNFLRTRVDVGTVRAEHDFEHGVTLRNQVRYGHFRRAAQITEGQIYSDPLNPVTPTTPLEDILVNRNQITVQSLETFLSDQMDATFKFKTGWLQHSVVTGVEGSRETSAPKRFTFPLLGQKVGQTINVPQTSLLNPDEDQVFVGQERPTSVVGTLALSVGLYAVDTVKLGKYVDVIGGVRYDRFDAAYHAINTTYKTDGTPVVAPLNVNELDNVASYRAGIVLKPTHDGSIYFSYGTSFNPSAESLSLTAAATAQTKPESNRTFELGTKWDLLRKRLSLAGAIFRTTKLNAREPSVDDPTENVNAGTQRVSGAQLSVTGRITDRWQVLSSYAYLDGKLVSSQFYPQFVGIPLANVPKNTFNLWTTYQLPWRLTAGGGTQFVDSRSASTTAPFDSRGLLKQIPSYWVFNAMASRPINDHVSFQVNMYNLANRYYFDEPHPAHIVPGAGFTALTGFNFRF